jgi:hypothetical protein
MSFRLNSGALEAYGLRVRALTAGARQKKQPKELRIVGCLYSRLSEEQT